MNTDKHLRKMLKYIVSMKITEKVSLLSYDCKHQVGSTIIDNDFSEIFTMSYNGNYPGGPNERDSMETGQSGFLHAEENAVISANITNPSETTLYVTMTPCSMCAKRIARKKIKNVIALKHYHETNSKTEEIFANAGINFKYLSDKIKQLYVEYEPYYSELSNSVIEWVDKKLTADEIKIEFQQLIYKQLDRFCECNKERLNYIPYIDIQLTDLSYENLVKQYLNIFYKSIYEIL